LPLAARPAALLAAFSGYSVDKRDVCRFCLFFEHFAYFVEAFFRFGHGLQPTSRQTF
jgi:hypothetical protein